MKIPYLTIGYDKYHREVVLGYAKYRISIYKENNGIIYWKRLFCIWKA